MLKILIVGSIHAIHREKSPIPPVLLSPHHFQPNVVHTLSGHCRPKPISPTRQKGHNTCNESQLLNFIVYVMIAIVNHSHVKGTFHIVVQWENSYLLPRICFYTHWYPSMTTYHIVVSHQRFGPLSEDVNILHKNVSICTLHVQFIVSNLMTSFKRIQASYEDTTRDQALKFWRLCVQSHQREFHQGNNHMSFFQVKLVLLLLWQCWWAHQIFLRFALQPTPSNFSQRVNTWYQIWALVCHFVISNILGEAKSIPPQWSYLE